MWLKARWLVKRRKRSWELMMWVMTDEPLPYFLVLLPVSIYSCLLILNGEQPVLLVSLWRKLVSVAAHQCTALTCRAVCRRVDIVASFKLRVANATLAFLRPNSRNLAFFKVVWHEKMMFGMYVILWHFFGLFWWCWHEKISAWN